MKQPQHPSTQDKSIAKANEILKLIIDKKEKKGKTNKISYRKR